MTTEKDSQSAALPKPFFWRFLQQIASDAELVAVIAHLRAHRQLDCNFLLFCCWFAQSGKGRLNRQTIQRLLPVSLAWHEGIVEGLGRMRDLVDASCEDRKALKGVRDTLMQDASLAEHIEQVMLADAGEVALRFTKRSVGRCISDACANLLTYARVVDACIDTVDIQHIHTILKATFSAVEEDKVTIAWRLALSREQDARPRAQLSFEFR